MGDGVLDNFNLIADQTNATLGNDLVTEGDFGNEVFAWSTSGSTVTTAIDGGLLYLQAILMGVLVSAHKLKL